jgi:hypothetical protein
LAGARVERRLRVLFTCSLPVGHLRFDNLKLQQKKTGCTGKGTDTCFLGISGRISGIRFTFKKTMTP